MTTYPMAMVSAPGRIEFVERALPERGPKDVLIGVKAASICGSDLHIYKGRHPSAPLPVAVGHELSGEVLEVGRDVTRIRPGDRVTVEPALVCGKCDFCQRGQYHLCTDISFQYRRGQGAFAPYFVAPEEHVFRIPDGLSYEAGSLIEPLAVAIHAVKKANISLGQSIAVFGAGAIGLLVMMLARRVSGGPVLIVDVQAARLQAALELGATRAIDSRAEDAVQVIMDYTQGLGVDRSFEAVGLEVTLVQALRALKKGGQATLLGIFEELKTVIPANLFIQREITLAGSQGYNWDFQAGLALLAGGDFPLGALVTHRYPLERIQEGFDLLLSPENPAIKVVAQVDS
jgi:2-desacetyl-2-hydroxyethyl bacteriochlorophyllide A dehydrogenase